MRSSLLPAARGVLTALVLALMVGGGAGVGVATPPVPIQDRSATVAEPAYLDSAALAARLHKLAAAHPGHCAIDRIGKSIEGRDLCALTITNHATGLDKPALFATACVHGNEVSTTPVLLNLIEGLLRDADAGDPDVAALLDRVMLYAVCCVNPDSMDRYLAGAGTVWRPRGNQRPVDEDEDGAFDEDDFDDLDGDGVIAQMRQRQPDGSYKALGWEGIDNDDDGKLNEDKRNGVDLNRNFPVGWQEGAYLGTSRGEGPLSEPESLALADFVESHPNIAMVLDYHNDGNCMFYRCGSQRDDVPAELATDDAAYLELLAVAEEAAGYAPRRMGEAGIFATWCYDAHGIPAMIVELDDLIRRHVDDFRDDQAAREYLARVTEEDTYVDWHTFDHPTLGEVEIGGVFGPFGRRNPPAALLPELCEVNVAFFRAALASLPSIELDVTAFIGDVTGQQLTTMTRDDDGVYRGQAGRHATYVELEVALTSGGIFPPMSARAQRLSARNMLTLAREVALGAQFRVEVDGALRPMPFINERPDDYLPLSPRVTHVPTPSTDAPQRMRVHFRVDEPGPATLRVRVQHPRAGVVTETLRVDIAAFDDNAREQPIDPRTPVDPDAGDNAPGDNGDNGDQEYDGSGYPPAPAASEWEPPTRGHRTTATAQRASCGPFVDGKLTGDDADPNVVTARPRTLHLGVILIEFPDHKHDPRFDRADFERMMFSLDGEYREDPTGRPVAGSVREFFHEMSYGLIDITGTVFDWVEVEKSREEQLARPMINNPYFREPALAALGKRDGISALAKCDGLIFLCAGNPGRRASGLWPHRGTIGGLPYIQLSEIHPRSDDQFLGMGVPAHELCHTFGFKDMYGLRNTRQGPGPFSLLGNGTHGWPPGDANFPHHLDPWCKSQLGWLEPTVIDPRTSQRLVLRAVTADRRECYKVLLREDGSEYFLLENRQRGQFEAHLPSTGLLIWHVGERRLAEGFPVPEMDVRLECAHGLNDLEDAPNRYARLCAFPLADRTSFTSTTVPASTSAAPDALPVNISNITLDDQGNVYFTIGGRRGDDYRVEHDGIVAITHAGIANAIRDENPRGQRPWREADPRELHVGIVLADLPDARFEADEGSRDVRRAVTRLVLSRGEYFRTDLAGEDVEGSLADYLYEISTGQLQLRGDLIRPLDADGAPADGDPWFTLAHTSAERDSHAALVADALACVVANRGKDALSSYQVTNRRAGTTTQHTFDFLVVFTPRGEPGAQWVDAADDDPNQRLPVLVVTGCRAAFGPVAPLAYAMLQRMLDDQHAAPAVADLLPGSLGDNPHRPQHPPYPLKRALFAPVEAPRDLGVMHNLFIKANELYGGAFRFPIDEQRQEYLVALSRQRVGFDADRDADGLCLWWIRLGVDDQVIEALALNDGAPITSGARPLRLQLTDRTIVIDNVWQHPQTGTLFSIYVQPDAADRPGTHIVPMPEFGTYFVLHVPVGYDPAVAHPLILDFHGASSPLNRPALYSLRAWKAQADSRGYVVALPQARKRAWGVYEYPVGRDDVAFGDAVLARVCELLSIDEARVLLTGFSSGADFNYTLGVTHQGRYRAVAPFMAGVFREQGLAEVDPKLPFYCVTGSADTPRRPTVFRAFLALGEAGFDVTYREAPGTSHRFPPESEYARVLDWFEVLDLALPSLDDLVTRATQDVDDGDTHRALATLRAVIAAPAASSAIRDEARALLARIEQMADVEVDACELDFEDGNYIDACEKMRTLLAAYHGTPAAERAVELEAGMRRDQRYREALDARRNR